MMLTLLLAALLQLSSVEPAVPVEPPAAVAAPDAPDAPDAAAPALPVDPEERTVCRLERVTGSRVGHRVCRVETAATRAEEARQQQELRQMTRPIDVSRPGG
jgi:hypothetical protein